MDKKVFSVRNGKIGAPGKASQEPDPFLISFENDLKLKLH
jgi:hypothetical protein